jgi:hypothetical protein
MATTPKWVQQQQQQQPCAPAARRAAGYTVVRCSSLPEGPAPQLQLPPPIRRSANYQPNSWNYDSLESSLAGCNKRNREVWLTCTGLKKYSSSRCY